MSPWLGGPGASQGSDGAGGETGTPGGGGAARGVVGAPGGGAGAAWPGLEVGASGGGLREGGLWGEPAVRSRRGAELGLCPQAGGVPAYRCRRSNSGGATGQPCDAVFPARGRRGGLAVPGVRSEVGDAQSRAGGETGFRPQMSCLGGPVSSGVALRVEEMLWEGRRVGARSPPRGKVLRDRPGPTLWLLAVGGGGWLFQVSDCSGGLSL